MREIKREFRCAIKRELANAYFIMRDNPNSKLMPEQVKYIRGLTDKIKAAQKNYDINAKL